MQQPPQQMLIEPPQSAHADLLAKFMQHPRRRQLAAQPGKPSPRGLFGQLRHQQVQGTGGRQPRQQMHAPELGRTQVVATPAGESAGQKFADEAIGYVVANLFEQGVGANRRQRDAHALTLTEPSALATPLESAQTTSHQPVTKTFGTPSKRRFEPTCFRNDFISNRLFSETHFWA